jgi:hypothetical protein
MLTDGDKSYQERNNRPDNFGEELFIAHCRANGLSCRRIGFDEKQGQIPNYWDLNKVIRQLPDFVVTRPDTNRIGIVQVKGTLKFKQDDYNNLAWSESVYGSPKAQLWYVFALKQGIYWLTVTQVADLYRQSNQEGQWPDGKTYRVLNIQ